MRNLNLLLGVLVIVLACLLTSCIESRESKSQVDAVGSGAVKVGKLLPRGEAIQYGKEWDYVQNTYAETAGVIAKKPEDSKAKIQLAQLFVKEARVTGEHGHYYPAALELLDHTIENVADDKDMLFLAMTYKAGVLLSLHEFEKALEVGNKAALLNPANAQIHGVLVDANVELGRYEKAVTLLDRMLQIKPDIRSYSRASYLREIHGDVDGSIAAMTMAIKAGYPGYEETAWAMLTLGDIYQQYGKFAEATKVYDQILAIRPNYPFALEGKAQVMIAQGEDKIAEIVLKQAIDIIPEVGYYMTLAELYKSQNRIDEVGVLVDEIMLMLEDDTASGHNMNMEYAEVYIELAEDTDKALQYAEKEYAKRPMNIDVNRLMAKALIAAGEHQKAERYIIFEIECKFAYSVMIDILQKLICVCHYLC